MPLTTRPLGAENRSGVAKSSGGHRARPPEPIADLEQFLRAVEKHLKPDECAFLRRQVAKMDQARLVRLAEFSPEDAAWQLRAEMPRSVR